jgi:predicted metal-dependent peptidase
MRKPTTENSKIISDEKLSDLKTKASIILSKARKSLLNIQPFIGTIAMSLNIRPVRDNRVDTAMTDGQNIYFDIDFLSRLTDDERVFIIAHEVWHNVMCHFIRTENRDRKLFNIATDIEVNELLASEGLAVPKDALMAKSIESIPGLSAEDYYAILLEKSKSNIES